MNEQHSMLIELQAEMCQPDNLWRASTPSYLNLQLRRSMHVS